MLIAPVDEPSPEEQPASESPSNTSLRAVLSPAPSPVSQLLGHSSKRFTELPEGTQLEVSPDSFRIARRVGELLESGKPLENDEESIGGCGLIVDYGGDKAYNNSFRVSLHLYLTLSHDVD